MFPPSTGQKDGFATIFFSGRIFFFLFFSIFLEAYDGLCSSPTSIFLGVACAISSIAVTSVRCQDANHGLHPHFGEQAPMGLIM